MRCNVQFSCTTHLEQTPRNREEIKIVTVYTALQLQGTTGEKKASLYLGRLWVCAAQGDVDDVGDDDEGACRP